LAIGINLCDAIYRRLIRPTSLSVAVSSRIDGKYALSLELTDPGFDFSVLCEFRTRLIKGGAEQQLLELLLKLMKLTHLLKVGELHDFLGC